jgi:hypothetical protein
MVVVVMRLGIGYHSRRGVAGGGSKVCSRMGVYSSRSMAITSSWSAPMTIRSR